MSLEAGEFTDYSFWRNEIQEAESIHDLFDICEELLEEIQIKADKNDLMKDLVVKAHICSKHYSDLLMHIDKRLHEFGGQNIPYEDWHWEVTEEQ